MERRGGDGEMSEQRRRRREEVREFKAGCKVKERKEERKVEECEVKRRKRRVSQTRQVSLRSSLSFYPGTKLLFRRRLFEFGKPAE